MDNKTQNILQKFSTQKVELNKINDITKLLEKGENQLKQAKNVIDNAKSELSRGLIIVAANVPPQIDRAMKLAEELGADKLVQDLKQMQGKAQQLRKEYEPLYNNIK